MKLSKVRVREYKSVWDSGPFDVDQVSCLVGKNESGKTALLEALYRLNPIGETDGNFDVTDDYPRSEVEDYLQDVDSGRREHAIVVEATFTIEDAELKELSDEYGEKFLSEPQVVVSKGYAKNGAGHCARYVNVSIAEKDFLIHLANEFKLEKPLLSQVVKLNNLKQLSDFLSDHEKKQAEETAAAQAEANQITDENKKAAALAKCSKLAESEEAKALRKRLNELLVHGSLSLHVWEKILKAYLPQFLYFNEYYQMSGHDNVEALIRRKDANELLPSDYPLLGLIELARLDLGKLLAADRTQELKNKLQGASNHLSNQILKYWSQNKHLRMNFDVRPGLPGDPRGMTEGTNIWGEVFDSTHLVSTGLGTRSSGFVWFFSFLAWYSAVKKKNQPLVLLLDEPGLSLHGKAQGDLLQYFESEVLPNPKHQLIYTTHSPFMVDSQHFGRVRIVQDKGIDSDKKLPREEDGTKVLTDVLEAGPDSLFPLQGALGYEIHQTLFVGPNSLVVEGVSDLLYIQTVSGVLQANGRTGLDNRWTITPVGGLDKVPTFVALIGSQKNLNVATLVDVQAGDQQKIENLYKKKLLSKTHVFTFSEFTEKKESDIEDMFDEGFYMKLVNGEFSSELATKILLKNLSSRVPRILVRLEGYFSKNPLKGGAQFNHYRPARYFAENAGKLGVPDTTLTRFEIAFKTLNALLPT